MSVQIYQLCLAGNGPTKIARMLTEQQIPTTGDAGIPQDRAATRRYHPGYECKWATNTVVHLLENREYTGCLVNFKTEKPSYKVKHSVENPIEKQAIFPNHHEPIIDTENMGSVCRSYASSENARTAMMKWGCSLVCCSAPTAAMCCISSGIRTRTASRTVISAAATRSVPVTVRHTLSAPTF